MDKGEENGYLLKTKIFELNLHSMCSFEKYNEASQRVVLSCGKNSFWAVENNLKKSFFPTGWNYFKLNRKSVGHAGGLPISPQASRTYSALSNLSPISATTA